MSGSRCSSDPRPASRGSSRRVATTRGNGPRRSIDPAESMTHIAPLLTDNQVAKLLSIHRRTLRRMVACGTFPPPIKIGFSSRWPLDHVVAYIDERIAARDAGRGGAR